MFEDEHRYKFTMAFITQFLAAYAANMYDETCASGKHERFDHLPVEDAVNLADRAWLQFNKKVMGR